jgi:hypothetical protein
MVDVIVESTRAAAECLAAELGPRLGADVEAALSARGPTRVPDRFVDPVSLGGLVVSVATLAWTIYTDLKSKTAKPEPDIVARHVRVELRQQAGSAPAHLERIIDVVVTEVVQAAEKEGA